MELHSQLSADWSSEDSANNWQMPTDVKVRQLILMTVGILITKPLSLPEIEDIRLQFPYTN